MATRRASESKSETGNAARGKISVGPLEDLIGYHIRRARDAVFQDFAASLADLELTPGQVGVLVIIRENAGLKQTALADALGVDRSTVVAVMAVLERRALIRRAAVPADRRAYALHLTAGGRALLAKALDRIAAHEARLADGLDEARRGALIEALRAITANARRR